MTSQDLTLLLVSDGEPWGRYVTDRLNRFPQVRHQSILMDHLLYQNPPEVTQACRQSAVVVLVVTPDLLEFMEASASWFAPALNETPPTSAVVVFHLLDPEMMDRLYDVAKGSYVSADWIYYDPGYEAHEVQQTIARVLDLVEKCQAQRAAVDRAGSGEGGQSRPGDAVDTGRLRTVEENEGVDASSAVVSSDKEKKAGSKKKASPAPSTRKGKVVEFFPSVLYESGVRVAMVFKQEVSGDITIKVDQTDICLTTQRENEKVFTFLAPELAPGKHRVVVEEGGRARVRTTLTVWGVEERVFRSPQYLCQVMGVPDLPHLDLRLKDVFSASVPSADCGLETIFQHLSVSEQTEQQVNSETLYPTLLHYAAAHGLSEFCAALLESPGSSNAFMIPNCDGHNPAELADLGGFEELQTYILDFMEMQAAKHIYDSYLTMHPLSASAEPDQEDQEDYEDMTQALASTSRSRTMSEPAVTVAMNLPPPPPSRGGPLSSAAEQAASQDSAHSAGASRSDRPPLPPPRVKVCASSPRSQSERCPSPSFAMESISEVDLKARTLPAIPSSGMSASEFMGMGKTDPFRPALSKGALGSRSQDELIELHEMVKNKEINLNEARMLFNAWHERYGKKQTSSFKERQKELDQIKAEYQKVREALNKKGSKSSKSIFARMGLGGRQANPTIKLNITEPVVQREGKKKGTKVYTKSASTSQLFLSCSDRTSTASSSSSSRDSGWSMGSRDSQMSSAYEGDSEIEEVFDQQPRMRRSSSARDPMKRVSLGHQFLQQTEEEGGQATPPPSLPPRSNKPNLPPPPPQ
ncbi:uncharacterized protein LOC143292482 isoform X2 [Babylonia areolata]